MTSAIITRHTPDLIDPTLDVLANAFVTNPLHVAVFEGERLEQNRLFFRIALEHMFRATAFVGLQDGEVCGYMHFGHSPSCLPPADQVQTAGETILKPLGSSVPRIVEWFETWSRLDPDEPHVHLGPIGVSPAAQGGGLGSALMDRFIEHLDRGGLAGYLETDRRGNVEFYRKFGFDVQHEQPLVGTPTWYMSRPASSPAA